MTQPLTQAQVDEALRKWDLRPEIRPSSEEYAVFAPIRDEFERLHKIPEAQRQPHQREAHAEILSALFLTYSDSAWFAWNRTGLSPTEMNDAYRYHVAQYQQ